MKKLISLLFGLLIIFNLHVKAQESSGNAWRPESFSMGPGIGLDYGGIGVQMIAYPQKNIGIFFGGGTAIAGFGYNAGIKLRIQKPGSPVDPFFMAMYGYNAVGISDADKGLNRIFYGPSFAIGFDLHKRRNSLGYWSFALLVPIRNSDAVAWARNNGTGFTPITVSFGYKFMFP
ncbi:MAG TPA: hypothetical protein VHT72_09635 [Puia sp.]|nr:hypothetical protein [Puia sp.]